MVRHLESVRVVVEIDRAEPFCGTVAEPEQPVRTFNGWIAFASAIAAVVSRIDPGVGRGELPEEPTAG
jgi:hypothetical protein